MISNLKKNKVKLLENTEVDGANGILRNTTIYCAIKAS